MSARKPWLHNRVCAQCPTPITRQSKTGLCRGCCSRRAWSRDGAVERRSATLRQTFADPAIRAQRSENWRAWYEQHKDDPAWIAHMAASAAHMRAKAAATRSWCPPVYAELNATLIRQGYRSAERKQIVATQILADAERNEAAERDRRAKMTPHERRMEAVRNGAGISERPPMPSREHAMTLGGVASGML